MNMMMKKGKHSRTTPNPMPAVAMLLLFAALVACLLTLDQQPIAADGTMVGLGSANLAFHNLTGVNWTLYDITEYGGYVAIASMFVFVVRPSAAAHLVMFVEPRR